MKTLFTILLSGLVALSAAAGSSQNDAKKAGSSRYFLIDPSSKEYALHTVMLDAKPLYNVKEPVEVYNVMYNNTLIAFTVLPPQDGSKSWEEISFESGPPAQTFSGIKQLLEPAFQSYVASMMKSSEQLKRFDITPVMKRGEKYYKAKHCLTEYFKVVSQAMVFPNMMGNSFINVQSPPISVKSFEEQFKKVWGRNSSNIFNSLYGMMGNLDRKLVYRSDSLQIAGMKGHRFWQHSDWHVSDYYNYHRGADRFVFVPSIGIVAGSYDFWFAGKISERAVVENYFAEKVMNPISIDGKPVR